MMQYFTSPDGLKLAYRDEGKGIPILCLPGLTRDNRDFDYLAPHLSKYRLIRPDYRGRGASQWCDEARDYSVPKEAKDVIALLDHLGIDKAAIIGTSRGGLIAMFLAATAKDRLIGVCLNDVGPELTQAGLDKIVDYIGRNPAFKTRAEMAAAMPDLMDGFFDVPPERWLAEVMRHTNETDAGLKITYDPKLRDVVVETFNAPAPDLWPLFEALDGLPIALLRAENSDLLSVEAAEKMRRHRPDMTFATIPKRAHIPFLDEPVSLTAITTWLKDCT